MQREIKVVDGKAFLVTTQPLTKEQVEAIRANQVQLRSEVDAIVADIDDKLPTITATEIQEPK